MYIRNEDTICAPATVPGTGAISVIRISGPQAFEIADKVISCRKGRFSDAEGYTIRFGTVYVGKDYLKRDSEDETSGKMAPVRNGKHGEVLDEVLVSIFRGPHSYTGEDSVEISCHASSYIVSTLMGLLYDAGARAALPGEFTQRAFLNGKMDLAQAEAVADVIASQNAAAHRIAFRQMKGGFSSELRDMRSELLEIVSLMELELDFSEEEVEFADRSRLDTLLSAVISHTTKLIDSFRLGNAIKNGVPVAIAGATNTGKSTLLNALLGEDRAIVSDIHGTTRDTIEETLNIGGILFRFIDTAGLRETSETVEKIGIERTFQKISEASVVLGMIDLTRDFDSSCETVREIIASVDFDCQKVIFLLNKTDICPVNKNVNIINFIVSLIENKGYNTNLKDIGIVLSSAGGHEGHESDCRPISAISPEMPEGDKTHTHSEDVPQSDCPNGAKTPMMPVSRPTVAMLPISAKTGDGLTGLRILLTESQRDLIGDGSATLVTNERHAQALTDTRTSLLRVRDGLASGLSTDLAAQDIREAIYHLGSIVGEISTDEVLGNIFQNFCIGK